MCAVEDGEPARKTAPAGGADGGGLRKRPKIWELDNRWHCSIVGTCLSLAELRRIVTRLKLSVGGEGATDYDLHGFFVRQVAERNAVSKLIHKTLERKYAAIVKRLSKLAGDAALLEAWRAAVDKGDVAGTYWALMTHPGIAPALEARIYGEVHMLSHLASAASRDDSRRLNAAIEENRKLAEQFDRFRAKVRDRMAGKEALISDLKARLSVEKGAGERVVVLERRLAEIDEADGDPVRLKAANDELWEALTQGNRDREALTARLDKRERRIVELEDQVRLLMAQVAGRRPAPTAEPDDACAGCPYDLNGMCVLYVGGLLQHTGRFKQLVESRNGVFMHHDGGMEQSEEALSCALGKADAVFFPTTCVSHSAMQRIKKLCRHNRTPFVPVRSTGISAFAQSLSQVVERSEG